MLFGIDWDECWCIWVNKYFFIYKNVSVMFYIYNTKLLTVFLFHIIQLYLIEWCGTFPVRILSLPLGLPELPTLLPQRAS